jgi:hypothetical protein
MTLTFIPCFDNSSLEAELEFIFFEKELLLILTPFSSTNSQDSDK